MGTKICLLVVEPELGRDCVVSVTEAGFPILKGEESEHVACGACRDILAWNLSLRSLRSMFRVVHRLLLKCSCGAHNQVPQMAHEHGLKTCAG